MKHECEIVQDLLPTYLDHTCSGSSRELVEEHTAACSACKKILDAAVCDLTDDEAPIQLPDAANVLRRASWKLHRRAILQSLGVLAVVLYWLVYLWAKSLADHGIYRYFSWSVWEVFSGGTLVVPLLTALWLIIVVIRSVRNKTWKKNAVMAMILILLAGGQIGYLHDRAQIVSVSSWTAVKRIPDEYHIVITSGEDTEVVLETTPTITRLVRTDGTVYGFEYEQRRDAPDQGVLLGVWDTVDQS